MSGSLLRSGLLARQATEAVRDRITWKCALGDCSRPDASMAEALHLLPA